MAQDIHPHEPAAAPLRLTQDPNVGEAMARLRAEGRLILDVPLDKIARDHLIRDRTALDQEELRVLAKSIFSHGQRTPIELSELPAGSPQPFGLISGWRRVCALEMLHRQTGDARYANVLAIIRRPRDAADAYVSMVEENEVRLGLSYYERARIAARATELGVFETEKKALLTLFDSASRAKRSRIRQFLYIYHALDGKLAYPGAIGERMGLSVAMALKERPEAGADLQAIIADLDGRSAEAEAEALTRFVAAEEQRNAPTAPSSQRKGPIADETIGDLRLRLYKGRIVVSGKGADAELFDLLRDALSDRQT